MVITKMPFMVLFILPVIELLGLSVYGSFRIHHLLILSLMPFVIWKFIKNGVLTNRVSNNGFHAFIFFVSILVSVLLSLTLLNHSGDISISFWGGVENYISPFLAYLFFKLSNYSSRNSRYLSCAILTCCLLTVSSIIFYFISPGATSNFISELSFGTSQTGQWRFSSFFGLPYYAAVVYLYFLVCLLYPMIFLGGLAQSLSRFLFVLVLLYGGIILGAKTFVVGIVVVSISVLFQLIRKFVLKKGLINRRSAIRVLIPLLFLLPLVFLGSEKILEWGISTDVIANAVELTIQATSLDNLLNSLMFRYSSENYASAAVLADSNIELVFGSGVYAGSVPADSQFRDSIYRFGVVGMAIFMLFPLRMFFLVDYVGKIIILVMCVAAFGSNGFTPIGASYLIWLTLFSRTKESKKLVLYD